MNKTITFLLLFLVANKLVAQQVKGKIIADYDDLSGVNVENHTQNLFSRSDKNGNFEIKANVDDLLVFSAIQFNKKEIVIQKEDMLNPDFTVFLQNKINPIEEVEIDADKPDAVKMGILQKPAKTYTPAERKVRTAEELHWYSPLLIPLGGMSVDGMINSISGRTKQLKKEVVVEKKELLLVKINDLYEENYFTEKLKIPPDYIKGFQYYLVENTDFINAVNAKNKTLTNFLLIDLSSKYLETISEK